MKFHMRFGVAHSALPVPKGQTPNCGGKLFRATVGDYVGPNYATCAEATINAQNFGAYSQGPRS
eukprot:428407-Pelagomonas_calceolata.AAC.4